MGDGAMGFMFLAVPGEARLHVQKSKPSIRPRNSGENSVNIHVHVYIWFHSYMPYMT